MWREFGLNFNDLVQEPGLICVIHRFGLVDVGESGLGEGLLDLLTSLIQVTVPVAQVGPQGKIGQGHGTRPYVGFTSWLRRMPMPSTSTSTVDPGSMGPIPGGVPVVMMSMGSKVMTWEA